MPLIDQSRKLHLAHVNPTPKRNGRRAGLCALERGHRSPDGFRWPAYPNPITMRTMHAYEAYLRGRQLA